MIRRGEAISSEEMEESKQTEKLEGGPKKRSGKK